jgi:aminoglycoside/choline kinase family phosphotransferase
VASLCQDARVFVPLTLEKQLLNAYMEARHGGEGFDPFAFHKAYRVMGAQRATKVLGIFARLAKRDNKPQHLDKLPIVRDYLARNLEHLGLAQLAEWHRLNLPLDVG